MSLPSLGLGQLPTPLGGSAGMVAAMAALNGSARGGGSGGGAGGSGGGPIPDDDVGLLDSTVLEMLLRE